MSHYSPLIDSSVSLNPVDMLKLNVARSEQPTVQNPKIMCYLI